MIPGKIILLLTFPGVIVHDRAHKFFCDIIGVPVYKVCYWQYGDPAGYVIHAKVTNVKHALLIALEPLIINTILCMFLTFFAIFPMVILSVSNFDEIFFVLMWVGISIGMSAFPSNQDIQEFLHLVKQSNRKNSMYIFAKIFAPLLYLVNSLRIIWIDTVYAFGVSMILPQIAMLF